jgi:glycosyltransferase involved in cell wall biosynthesis
MEIIKNKYHIRPKKMFYIPNGVDLEKFRPAKDEEKTEDEEILKKYGLNQKKYIAFWGRMEPVKGISNLIKGFDRIVKRNPEYELVILSIPSNWEYYHNEVLKIYGGLSQEVKSKVKIFTEKFPEKELLTLIRNASIGAFPSIKEAFGLVAVEAQACGLPVVVGNTGGLKENVIEKKTGVLVNGNNPDSIASGLEYVIANRKELAENTLPFSKKYDWNSITEKYVKELYNF